MKLFALKNLNGKTIVVNADAIHHMYQLVTENRPHTVLSFGKADCVDVAGTVEELCGKFGVPLE